MSGHVEVIKITEIKSPSQFFYLLSDDPKLKLIKQLEVELSKIAAQREEESEFHPSVGQVKSFAYVWLRAIKLLFFRFAHFFIRRWTSGLEFVSMELSQQAEFKLQTCGAWTAVCLYVQKTLQDSSRFQRS